MAPSRDECRPTEEAEADHVWFFDEDGSLSAADRAPRLQVWLGMGYAMIGLVLGSAAWLGWPARYTRGTERAHAEAQHIA